MATRKPRVKATALNSLEGVADYERRIGSLLRERSEIENETEREVKKLVDDASGRTAMCDLQILALAREIYQYADANRSALTDFEKRKTVDVPAAGTIQWYMTQPAIELKDNADAIIARIKTLNLDSKFIRIKEEINKEALLEEPDVAKGISGIEIKQGEKFAIRPLGRDERVECTIPSNRWKIAIAKKKALPEIS